MSLTSAYERSERLKDIVRGQDDAAETLRAAKVLGGQQFPPVPLLFDLPTSTSKTVRIDAALMPASMGTINAKINVVIDTSINRATLWSAR
jgi:hypothetical protein